MKNHNNNEYRTVGNKCGVMGLVTKLTRNSKNYLYLF